MTPARRPTRMLATAALALTLALAACGGGSSDRRPAASTAGAAGGGEGASVKVALFRFQPGTLEVPVGTTVTWRNDDAVLHTVTAGAPGQPTGDFDEELPDKAATASVTFDEPGTFPYFCDRHPEAMRGEIKVVR